MQGFLRPLNVSGDCPCQPGRDHSRVAEPAISLGGSEYSELSGALQGCYGGVRMAHSLVAEVVDGIGCAAERALETPGGAANWRQSKVGVWVDFPPLLVYFRW